jgi:hypothetical protein
MEIKTVQDFDKALEYGPYAWPGGYPRYFICADSDVLSFKAAQDNADEIRNAIASDDVYSGWRVVAIDINWEDTDLFCSHSNMRIESAYGE